jgi:hypothetical protein
MIPPTIVYATAVTREKGLAALRSEMNPATVVAGLATFGAYALVLAALERAPAAWSQPCARRASSSLPRSRASS